MESDTLILQAIYDAISEINQSRDVEHAVPAAPETLLIGEAGQLDSLGFVNFVVAAEENVERLFGQTVSIIDIVAGVDQTDWSVSILAKRMTEEIQGITTT